MHLVASMGRSIVFFFCFNSFAMLRCLVAFIVLSVLVDMLMRYLLCCHGGHRTNMNQLQTTGVL